MSGMLQCTTENQPICWGTSMDTLRAQWLSLSVIVGVAIISTIYLQCALRTFCAGYWDRVWWIEHRALSFWCVSLPSAVLWGPTVEELASRMPLLLFFTDMKGLIANIGIIFMAILFGAAHLITSVAPGFVRIPADVAKHKPQDMSDVLAAVTFGLMAGVLAIGTQLLWPCVVMHVTWNGGQIVCLNYKFWLKRHHQMARGKS